MKLVALPWLLRQAARRVHPLETLDLSRVRSAALFNTTALGDTLLSTPVARELRRLLPHARILWMMHPAWIPLFANNPHVDGFLPFDNRATSLPGVWRKCSGGVDLALISHGNDPEASLAALLMGARHIVKTPHGDHPELHSNQGLPDPDKDLHGIHKRLAALELLTGGRLRAMDLNPRMELIPAACGALPLLLERLGISAEEPMIGFQVGASTVSRRWPPRLFADLARRLLAELPHRLLLLGSASERTLTHEVMAPLTPEERARVVDLAGGIPLPLLPDLLTRVQLLVTPDTGVMHMAVALGTPTVTLFAVAHHSGSGALVDRERHRFIQGNVTCSPCVAKACTGPEAECMAAIGVDLVRAEVMGLLECLA